jgi:hypothetical protein
MTTPQSRQQPDRDVRNVRALRRLGTENPRCACGETDPAALTGTDPDITCSKCLALGSGKEPYEGHHPAGRNSNQAVARIPINDHRVLSDLQRDWPDRTLRNPEGSPLLAAAAAVRSVIDYAYLLITRVIGWVPEFLEWLDEQLVREVDREWWTTLGWPGMTS